MPREGKRDFDAAAAHWDEEPRRVKLGQEVAGAIRREVPLTPEMAALDYGCGSGLVTLGLQAYVASITGADSSQGMLAVLEEKVRERGVANVDTAFIDLERQGFDRSYDLIVSSMTMHHVEDVAALIASLVQRLNPGGWLAIADLETEDGSFHEDLTGVLHHGFSRELLRSEFEACGLQQVRVVSAATMEKTDKVCGARRLYPVILAVGTKGR
jgi:2-polyprenyl-3-methyl-5-hydroxy-6-metoxy-1,4-benzoquinol methylase